MRPVITRCIPVAEIVVIIVSQVTKVVLKWPDVVDDVAAVKIRAVGVVTDCLLRILDVGNVGPPEGKNETANNSIGEVGGRGDRIAALFAGVLTLHSPPHYLKNTKTHLNQIFQLSILNYY